MRPYYNDGFLRTDAFSKNEAGIIIPVEDNLSLSEEMKESYEKYKEKLNCGMDREEINDIIEKRK